MKPDTRLVDIAAKRFRIAIALTAAIMFVYFGFILLVAFDKALLAQLMTPGLSIGIALGAAVIFVAFLLTGVYVQWANKHYDAALDDIRGGKS
jgi:uncharacterized membrane protein (DUF485 family)